MQDNKDPSAIGTEVKVTFAEKEALEREYRKLLVDDLMNSRTRFSAGPYEAHIQFSNFCNMSCIMCWDGNNPPTKKTDADLLKRIGEQVGPHLSIVTPYSGSEPLILTWDETRAMAKQYGILLCITTNVQFLDEAKFHELKDIAETLILSIDSHIPAVFDKIRPRSNSKKVFANLATAARLAAEHNLECIVNIVFMTQNAPMLTDTLNYMADLGIQNVNVIQLLDVNASSRMYDPLLHYSEEYVAWIKKNCIATAKQRKFRLIWSVSGYAEFDFREPGYVLPKTRKNWNDEWDEKMKLFFPRFCRNAYGRLRIDSEGDVSPCCYATQGELSLGNVKDEDFDQIWNSTEAQDLRRGMFTEDVPALCKSCRYHDLIKPFASLPFVESEEAELSNRCNTKSKQAIASLQIVGPNHGHRSTESVTFEIRDPGTQIDEFMMAISLGGQTEEVHHQSIEPVSNQDGVLTFELPDQIFDSLKTNVGYWWMIWAIPVDRHQKPVRCEEVRCVIRHKEMPRLAGSKLHYVDQGFVPVSDLGGNKKAGWQDPNHLPARPVAAFHGRGQLQESAAAQSSTGTVSRSDDPSSAPETKPAPGILKRLLASAGRSSESGIKDACLEVISQKSDSLMISGWVLLNSGAADSIEIVCADGAVVASAKERHDIAAGFPEHETAINAGFEAVLPDEMFWNKDRYQFAIIAWRDGHIEFRCNVQCRGGLNHDEATKVRSIRNGVLEV